MEGGFLDQILVDALSTALAVRMVRRFVDPSKITLEPSNGLSRERLQRVCDYIEAHLDDRLTLDGSRRGGLSQPLSFQPLLQAGGRCRSYSDTSCNSGSSGQKP